MKKPFFLSLAGLILFACGSKPMQTASEQITVDFDAPQPTWKIEKVVPLETNSESLYGRFFRVRVTDTHIFVQDMQQILVFDADGRYLSKVDRVGHGPQEYITISHFWPYNNELYIVSNTNYNGVKIYTYTGEFVRSISLDFPPSAVAVTDSYMAFKSAYNEAGTLVVTDRDGKIRYETISPILAKTTVSMPAMFPFTEANRQLYYFPDFASDIYTVGADSSDVKRIHFDFGKYTITPDFVARLTAGTLMEEFSQNDIVSFPNFNPSNRWWGMTFSLSGKEYTWYYEPSTGAQRIAAAEGTIAVKPIACATEHGFVASVEAARFLEDPQYAPWRDSVQVDENDNAVLIFYTVE